MSSKPKIVLYNPKSVFYDFPLALLAIGSNLNLDKYQVVIIDARIEKDAHKLVLSHIKDALCFGVTALTGKPLKDALKITKLVKETNPKITTIWGGWHPSLFGYETLKDAPFVDISVQGQGEGSFKEIIEAIDANSSVEAIKGICYRKDGKINRNAPRSMEDMDNFNPINYSLIDVERYFTFKKRKQFDYISSTGCYFKCAFCADPFVYKNKWTAITPERMGEELEQAYKKYSFTDINFQDETFFTNRRRVVKIANQLIDRNIKATWAGTMRADQGIALRDEEWALCKKSGLRRVLIGVESGTQEMMDWLQKDIKLEQVLECAEKCKQHGIAVIFPFIIGFPNETEESVDASLKLAKKLNAMDARFTTPIFYFKPYPGSKITIDVVKKGFQLPKTIEEWSTFDYIGSSSPWVDAKKYKYVQNFKFYNKIAFGKKRPKYWLIQQFAKLRCKLDFYSIPIEKEIAKLLFKRPELS